MSKLLSRVTKTERRLKGVHLICGSCSGDVPGEPTECESLDCPWLFERRKIAAKAEALTAIYDLLDEMEKEWSGERVYNVREYDSEVYITAEDDDGEGDDDKEEDDEEALEWNAEQFGDMLKQLRALRSRR